MKKIKFLSILLLAVFSLSIIVSCGDDEAEDDSLAVTKENLVGSWIRYGKGTSSAYKFNSDGTGKYEYTMDNVLVKEVSYTFTYNLDGSTLIVHIVETLKGKNPKGDGLRYQVTLYKNRMELLKDGEAKSYDRIQ